MANEEHKALAQFVKNVHSSLRKDSVKHGTDKAWKEHCKNSAVLKEYAFCMQKLASNHWENSCVSDTSSATSRIAWAANFCYDYFNNLIADCRKKESDIATKIEVPFIFEDEFIKPYKLLDVGSCYNPFSVYEFLTVLPIDLCPANESVQQCDFLNVNIGLETIINQNIVMELEECSFDIVTFCFVLEYMPCSEQRLEACRRAYKILKQGGLMIIATPDSKHVGANSKIMKCWRYALACLGFNRIKYQKLQHMHCMAFRKSLHIDIPKRWALLHKQNYMDIALHIPQDFQIKMHVSEDRNEENYLMIHDFTNMPFCELFLEND